jgi:hypothetical protein
MLNIFNFLIFSTFFGFFSSCKEKIFLVRKKFFLVEKNALRGKKMLLEANPQFLRLPTKPSKEPSACKVKTSATR